MIKTYLLFIPFIFMFLLSCQNHQHEEQLAQREKALLARERQFSFKEKDYQALLHMRDSLIAEKDSVNNRRQWPDSISGLWKSKVICRASNCSEYIIGDQRNDNWEFTTDSTGMIAKMTASNTVTRIFSGHMENGTANLHFTTDSAAQRQVDMHLVLHAIKQDFLSGTQVIKINNSCTATFDIELVRASNN